MPVIALIRRGPGQRHLMHDQLHIARALYPERRTARGRQRIDTSLTPRWVAAHLLPSDPLGVDGTALSWDLDRVVPNRGLPGSSQLENGN